MLVSFLCKCGRGALTSGRGKARLDVHTPLIGPQSCLLQSSSNLASSVLSVIFQCWVSPLPPIFSLMPPTLSLINRNIYSHILKHSAKCLSLTCNKCIEVEVEVEVRASLPPETENKKLFQTANMALTMSAVTRPPDPQNRQTLSVSPSQLYMSATQAPARGIHKVYLRESIQNAASVLLHPYTSPGTAKKLADRFGADVESAVAA